MNLAEIKQWWSELGEPSAPHFGWLIAEVERLTQLNAAVMAERHEMHDRLLSRAGEAEGRVLRLTEEVETLKRRVDIWKGQAAKYQQAEEWQIELRKQAESSLTRSKAEGRREAFEEAADLALGYAKNEDNMVDHVYDGHQHAKYPGLRIAAAIRQQAQEGNER